MNVKKYNWMPGTPFIAGTIPVLVTLLILLFLPANLPAEEVKPVEDLSGLVAIALANNPDLKASEARWEMFRNKIAQARSLDDPMLTLAIRNGVLSDPLNFGMEPMTGKVIGLSQKLPFWGKRELKGEIAAKTAESYSWTVEERKVELARMVKEAWYQIYYIDKSLDIVDKNIKILDDFIYPCRDQVFRQQGGADRCLQVAGGALEVPGYEDYPGSAEEVRTGEP